MRTWVNERLGRRALIWAAVLGLAAGVLSALPLFDLLGYDFSFAIGFLAAFAAVDLGQGTVAAARRAGRPLALGELTATAIGGALALLALPLAISLLNALRVRNCSLGSGFAFYALLPVSTVLYAAPAGVVAGLFRRRGRLVAWALPVGSIVWALGRLYSDPAVFAYDPFGGYFPGPIYDEALRPPARLVWFRVVNLLWIGSTLLVTDAVLRRSRRRAAVAGLLVVASLVLFHQRGALGFHVQRSDLTRVLSRRTESTHFVLIGDPASGQTPEDIALVHRDLEFRYHQLGKTLGVEPAGRVTVYQFPSTTSKKELVGAGQTLYAKPWSREIFVQVDRFPGGKLRHELAHVFAGAFGDPVFGVSMRWLPFRLASGLVEGVAEAADFGAPDGATTIHQDARAIVAQGQAPPLDRVVGAGFSVLAGARAYTIAGSFCHFLLQRHGAEKLRALYRTAGDFTDVYGQPLAVLEQEWRAFLEQQPLPAAERARAAERFRRGAIFGRVCARDLAARVAEARALVYSVPERAIALLDGICADDPGEPLFRLDRADALAADGKIDRALAEATGVANDESFTLPVRARAVSLMAALQFQVGRLAESEAAVRRGQELATDEGEERNGQAKLRALADPDARRTLGRVLFGDSASRGMDQGLALYLMTEFSRLFPDEALGSYLVGRQLAWRDPPLALMTLSKACPAGDAGAPRQPLAPLFQRECRRLLADAAFRAGDLAASRAAHERIKADAANEAERLRATDFIERIEWELVDRAVRERR